MKMLELVEVAVEAVWSCSGRRLPRSMYSHAINFWTNFCGIEGHPGKAVKDATGVLVETVVVEVVVVERGEAEVWAMLAEAET